MDCAYAAIYRAHGSAGIRIRELVSNVFPRLILQHPNWKRNVQKAVRNAAIKIDEQLIETLEATYRYVCKACSIVFRITMQRSSLKHRSN